MDDLLTLAIAKAIDAKTLKAARAAIEPGTHDVDALVRIRGGVKVGEDYTQSITSKVKPLDLWLATLDLLAPQVTDALVERIVERALADDESSLRRLKDLKARTNGALETVRDLTSRTCSGKVTTTLTAEKVEADVAAPTPADRPVIIVP